MVITKIEGKELLEWTCY